MPKTSRPWLKRSKRRESIAFYDDWREDGIVIAVFPTVDGNFRYAVDMEGYSALQFFTEENLAVHSN